MDNAKGGTLFTLSGGELTVEMIQEIMMGISFLHRNCLVHRDIKPENIFLDEDNHIKIGDFGLIQKYTGARSLDGTEYYLDPLLQGTYLGDVYSYAVSLFELIAGKHFCTYVSEHLTKLNAQKKLLPLPTTTKSIEEILILSGTNPMGAFRLLDPEVFNSFTQKHLTSLKQPNFAPIIPFFLEAVRLEPNLSLNDDIEHYEKHLLNLLHHPIQVHKDADKLNHAKAKAVRPALMVDHRTITLDYEPDFLNDATWGGFESEANGYLLKQFSIEGETPKETLDRIRQHTTFVILDENKPGHPPLQGPDGSDLTITADKIMFVRNSSGHFSILCHFDRNSIPDFDIWFPYNDDVDPKYRDWCLLPVRLPVKCSAHEAEPMPCFQSLHFVEPDSDLIFLDPFTFDKDKTYRTPQEHAQSMISVVEGFERSFETEPRRFTQVHLGTFSEILDGKLKEPVVKPEELNAPGADDDHDVPVIFEEEPRRKLVTDQIPPFNVHKNLSIHMLKARFAHMLRQPMEEWPEGANDLKAKIERTKNLDSCCCSSVIKFLNPEDIGVKYRRVSDADAVKESEGHTNVFSIRVCKKTIKIPSYPDYNPPTYRDEFFYILNDNYSVMFTSFMDPTFEKFVLGLDAALQNNFILNGKIMSPCFSPMSPLTTFHPTNTSVFLDETGTDDKSPVKLIEARDILSLQLQDVHPDCIICSGLTTDGKEIPLTFRTQQDISYLTSAFGITPDNPPNPTPIFTLKSDYDPTSHLLIFSRNKAIFPAWKRLEVLKCRTSPAGRVRPLLNDEPTSLHIQSIQVTSVREVRGSRYLIIKINGEEDNYAIEQETLSEWLTSIYPEIPEGDAFEAKLKSSKQALLELDQYIHNIQVDRAIIKPDVDFTLLRSRKRSRALSTSYSKPFVFKGTTKADLTHHKAISDAQTQIIFSSVTNAKNAEDQEDLPPPQPQPKIDPIHSYYYPSYERTETDLKIPYKEEYDSLMKKVNLYKHVLGEIEYVVHNPNFNVDNLYLGQVKDILKIINESKERLK